MPLYAVALKEAYHLGKESVLIIIFPAFVSIGGETCTCSSLLIKNSRQWIRTHKEAKTRFFLLFPLFFRNIYNFLVQCDNAHEDN